MRDQPGSPVEIRAVRLAALGASAASSSFRFDDARGEDGSQTRRVDFDGDELDAPIRRRRDIGAAPEPGPLLVDEYDTTVIVRPGWSVRRDEGTGTLILERADA